MSDSDFMASSPKAPRRAENGLPKKGPIVARLGIPGLDLWIDLDEKERDQAIADGNTVEPIGSGGGAPPLTFGPAIVKPTRRTHRKKAETSMNPPSLASTATASTKKSLTSLPLCQQCVRAMTLVERMRAANEGYKNTCEYLLAKSPGDVQARAMAEASATISQFAIGDAQYVLRNLACARGCLTIPGIPIVQHSPEP